MTAAESPQDTAFLDALSWARGTCARCGYQAVLTHEVGHIAQNSGSGFSVRFCRACVRQLLAQARAQATRAGVTWVPALPDDVAVPLTLRPRRAG